MTNLVLVNFNGKNIEQNSCNERGTRTQMLCKVIPDSETGI